VGVGDSEHCRLMKLNAFAGHLPQRDIRYLSLVLCPSFIRLSPMDQLGHTLPNVTRFCGHKHSLARTQHFQRRYDCGKVHRAVRTICGSGAIPMNCPFRLITLPVPARACKCRPVTT
jgi:hypothetical protein